MAKLFKYKVLTQYGQVLEGNILGENPAAVAAHLELKGQRPVKIEEEKPDLLQRLDRFKRSGAKETSILCRQLGTMTEAGMPLLTSLTVLAEQTEQRFVRDALYDVYKQVKEGQTLARAMSSHPNVFPSLLCSMIEAGELSGLLDQMLDRLALQFEKEAKIKQAMTTALVYPTVLLFVSLLTTAVLLGFVLPQFGAMYADMGVELPELTKMVLATSAFVQEQFHFILLFVFLLIFGVKQLLKRPELNLLVARRSLETPIFGMLLRKAAMAAFCRTLATMLKGGIPLAETLDVLRGIVKNPYIALSFRTVQRQIKAGSGIAAALAAQPKVFTPMVIHMAAIGEESGSLDGLLDKAADFYERETEEASSRMVNVLGPLFVLIFLGVVGVLVAATILPMADMASHIK